MKIINVNSIYVGNTHHSFIWINFNICRLMEKLHESDYKDFYLLVAGDSGYLLRPRLLTPLENESLSKTSKATFNQSLKTIRSIVERCKGLLKMRFRCLLKHSASFYAPEVVSKIVGACVVLHNICIERNIAVLDWEDDQELDFGLIIIRQVEADANDAIGKHEYPYLHEASEKIRR
ncbi:hypothetical protein FQA39_LY15144 [Lamprigera yunnana]|nr:hypothetical protein FQA39_LY15144 [Lamprigera yunnana]